MNLLTEPLAAKQGVRVNAVAPGYVGTELTLKGRSKEEWFGNLDAHDANRRLGEPSEIANAVLFPADARLYHRHGIDVRWPLRETRRSMVRHRLRFHAVPVAHAVM